MFTSADHQRHTVDDVGGGAPDQEHGHQKDEADEALQEAAESEGPARRWTRSAIALDLELPFVDARSDLQKAAQEAEFRTNSPCEPCKPRKPRQLSRTGADSRQSRPKFCRDGTPKSACRTSGGASSDMSDAAAHVASPTCRRH
ncbi:unnamed protein product [Symbiodinium natans]|uniref:Uncharacterized protein n=1 Tax=Symbiodinium natans TaxID=878477 RepID=A0A812II69_9DINO|nr:unnamed protein product [Symbiodinium natans]